MDEQRTGWPGRRAADIVARNTAVALGLLTLILIALVSFQYIDQRNYRQDVYERCIDRGVYDVATSESRQVEIEELRFLITLEEKLLLVAPEKEVFEGRIRSYERRARALEQAIDAVPRNECIEEHKP